MPRAEYMETSEGARPRARGGRGEGRQCGGRGVTVQRGVGPGTNSSRSTVERRMWLQRVAYIITAERVTGLPRRTASWPVLITSSLQ